jgi:hypothetical protein
MKRLALLATAAALVVPTSAGGFHHRFVPADRCGQSPNAGGANPTAVGAISTHNPAQGDALPLPPSGTPSQAATAPACQPR